MCPQICDIPSNNQLTCASQIMYVVCMYVQIEYLFIYIHIYVWIANVLYVVSTHIQLNICITNMYPAALENKQNSWSLSCISLNFKVMHRKFS